MKVVPRPAPRRRPDPWFVLALCVVVPLALAAAGVEFYAWWTVAHAVGPPPAWALWLLILSHR